MTWTLKPGGWMLKPGIVPHRDHPLVEMEKENQEEAERKAIENQRTRIMYLLVFWSVVIVYLLTFHFDSIKKHFNIMMGKRKKKS